MNLPWLKAAQRDNTINVTPRIRSLSKAFSRLNIDFQDLATLSRNLLCSRFGANTKTRAADMGASQRSLSAGEDAAELIPNVSLTHCLSILPLTEEMAAEIIFYLWSRSAVPGRFQIDGHLHVRFYSLHRSQKHRPSAAFLLHSFKLFFDEPSLVTVTHRTYLIHRRVRNTWKGQS